MTRRITAAFDVDGTLIDENDEPRQDIISVLRALMPYCDIVVWSGSGISYAKMQGRRIFLPRGIIYWDKAGHADISFDDQDITLGTVNINVTRREDDD